MRETLPFGRFVEVNPGVALRKGIEYPFVEMGAVDPVRRYVSAARGRVFKSGGARFRAGDTLFARITPSLENGKIAQFNGDATDSVGFGSTEFFVFRARPGLSDPAFVCYLARSEIVRGPAEKSLTGTSGRQRADLKSFVDLPVPAPPLPIQRKIAAILSAYDDLIENSFRRIEILEEMARNLYREWFVEFRFPGYERIRFVDSPVGRIPEGWAVRALGELAKVQTGRSNRQDADPEGEFVFFDRSREVKKSNRYLFDCEAVVVPGEGREFVARYWVGPFDLHQRVYALTDFRGIDGLHLYHAMLENRDYFARVATGATVKSLRKGMFERFPVVVPPEELRRRFSPLAGATQDQLKALEIRNAVLRQARDSLLPKLISGDIDVSALPVRTALSAADDVTPYENAAGA